eukprot:1986035-Amphidinium_carterae.1
MHAGFGIEVHTAIPGQTCEETKSIEPIKASYHNYGSGVHDFCASCAVSDSAYRQNRYRGALLVEVMCKTDSAHVVDYRPSINDN